MSRGDLRLVVPALIIAKVIYVVGRRLGSLAEAYFVRGLGSLDVEAPAPEDFARMAELIEEYADLPLGGTGASVVALAERLGAQIIVTLHRRHFAAVKPRVRAPAVGPTRSGAQTLDGLPLLDRTDHDDRDAANVVGVGDELGHGELRRFAVVAKQGDRDRVAVVILLKSAVAPPLGALYRACLVSFHEVKLPADMAPITHERLSSRGRPGGIGTTPMVSGSAVDNAGSRRALLPADRQSAAADDRRIRSFTPDIDDLSGGLRDGGCGSLITTEILPGKAQLARHNLRQAGLEDLVEICVGDAADLNKDDPDLLAYQQHVRRPGSGFFSCELPLDAGVELSVRLESQATQHSE